MNKFCGGSHAHEEFDAYDQLKPLQNQANLFRKNISVEGFVIVNQIKKEPALKMDLKFSIKQ